MNSDSEQSSAIKQALIVIQKLQKDLSRLQQSKSEPIAIIGMGCRFPGGVNSPHGFWRLLQEGKDGITEIPPEHWQQDDYLDKIQTNRGGFVPNLTDFDAQFFKISPREALSLDPQQRLLLEVSWEAMENAGITVEKLGKSQTGVFVGICGNDYSHRLMRRELTEIDAYLTTGNDHSLAAGRLSYFLDLTGPSLAVNTACSSSLVAVHLAITSLRNQECDLAIVSGVNRIISPEISINFSQARMLSPDGLCKTFDASANGFVRSEGCGVVILKRLAEAIAHQDNILAVLYGSAVNQDGRSNGLTAPNGNAQEKVIRQALKDSGKEPKDISYIEAHGTGTWLGDPIEVNALGRVFNGDCSLEQPLLLGSVKANLGHLEAAAGIASLIKVVLCLQHRIIPPQIHFHTPNPHINWQELPLKIPRELTNWSGNNRLAGVSSFGFGGTNAHVILGEGIAPLTTNEEIKSQDVYLFTLSAKTHQARTALIENYGNFLEDNQSLDLADLCYSSHLGRSHFNYRLAIVTSSLTQLQQQLSHLLTGYTSPGVFLGQIKSNVSPEILFIFPKQISQASELLNWLSENYPIVQQTIAQCDGLVSPYLGYSLLTPTTELSNLVLFVLQYSLGKLWQTWGITPTAIAGSGVGEWVGKTIAQMCSLTDSLMVLIEQKSPTEVNYQPSQIPIIPEATIASDAQMSVELDYPQTRQSLLTNLAQFYVQAFSIDWLGVESSILRPKILLPNYPFQRSRYWI